MNIDRIYAALDDAARYYRRALGSWVFEYLRERGLSHAVNKRWNIGYADDSWTSLTEHLRAAGYSNQELEATGIIRRNARGQLYDLFRDRLVVPIMDPEGRTLSFTARRQDAATGGKWINGSNSAIFTKGRDLLTAAPLPTTAPTNTVVLVEGFLDLVAVSHTLPNVTVLSTSGTALTSAAVDLQIPRDAEVVSAFDDDAGGYKATLRAWGLIPQLTVASLPVGQDPADTFTTLGSAALRDCLVRWIQPAALVAVTTYAASDDSIDTRVHALHRIARNLVDSGADRLLLERSVRAAGHHLQLSDDTVDVVLTESCR